jgi:hypothetical protein
MEYTGPQGGDFSHRYVRKIFAVDSDVVPTARYDRDINGS